MDDSEYTTQASDGFEDTKNLVPIPPRTQRRKYYLIEPALFLMTMASGLFDTVAPNIIEYQYCSAVLDRRQSDCAVNSTAVSQDEIQRYTAKIQMIRTAVDVTIPCILSVFMGPWSDKYGRRPLLISASIGIFIANSFWTWASNITTLNPLYFVLFSVPYAICGGSTFLYLSAFCYACDVSPIEKRSTRLGIIQAAILLGGLAGVQLCPYLNNHGGFQLSLALAAFLSFTALLYVYFLLPESVQPLSEEDRNSSSKNPFQLSYMKDVIDTCYTSQTRLNRLKITLIMMVLTISLIQVSGELGIMYLFLQRIVKIDISGYTLFVSYSILVGAIAATTIPWVFSQRLKVDDLYLLSFTIFPRILAALCIVYGSKLWHVYLSRTLNCTLGLIGPLSRSYLSKIIPEHQLGKVFSLMASAESSTPLFGSLSYTLLYDWTVGPLPEAVFLFSAFLMLVELLLVVLLIELQRMPSPTTLRPNAPSIN